MNQLTGIVAVSCAAPDTFLTLTSKDIPGTIVPTDRTKDPESAAVKNMIEFAVTDLVVTVARTPLCPALRLVIVAENCPTEDSPAATAVAGFPMRTLAGRREP